MISIAIIILAWAIPNLPLWASITCTVLAGLHWIYWIGGFDYDTRNIA